MTTTEETNPADPSLIDRFRETVEDLLNNVSEHCPEFYIRDAKKLLEETKP